MDRMGISHGREGGRREWLAGVKEREEKKVVGRKERKSSNKQQGTRVEHGKDRRSGEGRRN